MRILGIDPGTAITGFGVIDYDGHTFKFVDAGVIRTPKEQPMNERLLTVYNEMKELLAEFKPDVMSIELLFFARNVTTAMTVGQSRGIVMLAATQAKVPVFEYTPMQVKQAVTGYGKADKKQIQEMVKTLLKLDAIPKPDDAADGLAIAITHAGQSNLK
jgi:crossover junction endodeoxyribonuclease RuvC